MLRSLFGWNAGGRRNAPAPRAQLNVGRLDDRIVPAILVNEVMVNPPTNTDAPNEYIEIRVTNGTAEADLANLFVVVVEGEKPGTGGANPGIADYVYEVTSTDVTNYKAKFGVNGDGTLKDGLIFISGTGNYYSCASTNSLVILDGALSGPGAGLENGSSTALAVISTVALTTASDLDANDDGVLDTIAGVSYADGVGYRELGTTDFIYGAVISQSSGTPDVLIRASGNTTPFGGTWYAGEIVTGTQNGCGNWQVTPTFGTPPTLPLWTTAGATNPA